MTLYTPAQLLKPNVQSSLFADIVTAYKSVGKSEELGLELVNRARLPSLCSDYGLIQDLRDDLREHDYFLHSETYANFAKLTDLKRTAFQMHEIHSLNQRYLDSGGRLIFSGDDTLGGYVSAVRAGLRIVEGGRAVVSDHYGEIDPRQLNEGFGAFPLGSGQIQFTSALAVATGKHDWSISVLPATFARAGGNRKAQGWKNLPCDWRRMRVIEQDTTAFEPGFEGYKLFAKLYADGDMQKAFQIASALLGDDFAKLDWGSAIPLHVDEVDAVQAKLKTALTDPHSPLRNFEGYKKFAREKFCKGQMLKAFQIASALLGDDFAKLKWGSQIQLHVDEVDAVQAKLKTALTDPHSPLRNFEGYKTFTREKFCKGQMMKAFIIASALLGDDFAKLKWGSQIQLHVDEVDTVQAKLKAAHADPLSPLRNFEGYKTFAREKFCKGQMGKAFHIASALLGDDFAKLKWGSQILLHVDEVDAVQAKLKAALADPPSPLRNFEGYKTFAREKFCKGQMGKAFQIASALLGDDFAKLKWGSQIQLHVDEVDIVQEKLTAALADPHSPLRNFEGYKTFAREKFCKGQMHKAFSIASALLGDDFDQLKWGSQIHLHVDEVDAVQAKLKAAHADPLSPLRNFEGYKTFAREKFCKGQMGKAFHIVSALLGDDFAKLKWGSQIQLHVDQVDAIKARLQQAFIDGSLSASEGFNTFVKLTKTKPYTSYLNACALIGRDAVKQLGWPSEDEILITQKQLYGSASLSEDDELEADDDEEET